MKEIQKAHPVLPCYCVKCDAKTGPLVPVGADCPGWLCDDCKAKLEATETIEIFSPKTGSDYEPCKECEGHGYYPSRHHAEPAGIECEFCYGAGQILKDGEDARLEIVDPQTCDRCNRTYPLSKMYGHYDDLLCAECADDVAMGRDRD